MTWDLIWIAVAAGFAATLVLSAMQLMKQAMNLMPEMDMIGMISGMMGAPRAVGWLVHFMVGAAIYGLAFLGLAQVIDWPYWAIGLLLGAIGWLIAMLMMMPMAGKGVFGMKIGPMAAIASLMMHLVFGVVLGWVYGWLREEALPL